MSTSKHLENDLNLEKSADKYLRAGRKIGEDIRDTIYHFTSFITLATLTNLGLKTPRIDIRKELGERPEEYLERWLERVELSRGERSDIWHQLSEIQLKLTTLIASDERKSSDLIDSDLCDEVISLYERQIEKTMNIKVMVGEYEHMLFLKHILWRFTSMKKRRECIRKIKKFIKNYLPGI